MSHLVRYVGWTKGELLVEDWSDAVPYVPALKTIVSIAGTRYLVGAVEAEVVSQQGRKCDWVIDVKLART